jgi:TPR repeat protein
MRKGFSALLKAGIIAGSVLTPTMAAAYQGENEVIRGRYHEQRGDYAAAAEIYAGVVAREASPRAVRAAARRLVLITRAQGDVAAEMGWLEALVRIGDVNRLTELARRSGETGRLPPSFREMATVYEATAETLPSVGLAMFMAARAEAGDLAGTGVRNTDPLYWYGVAAARGSGGAASRSIARLVSEGRIDEAVALAGRLPAGRGTDEIVSIAKALARGENGMRRDRERAGKLLARVPDREANRIAAMLMRESSAAGDVDGAMFWLARAGSSPDGVAAAMARLHEKAADETTRERLLAELQRLAGAGDMSAAAAAGRILTGRGEPPTPELVRLMLVTAEGGTSATVDRLSRLIARMPAGDAATDLVVAELDEAGAGGDVVALTVLSRLHATGGPVAVDPVKSRTYAEKAAEVGSPEAQYRLGLSLAMGSGADADRGRALLAKAADAGYVPARAALAALVTETGSTP